MMQAKYTIEFHNKSGPYRWHGFAGTRRDARAKAMQLIQKSPLNGKPTEGYRLHFHHYVE